MKRPRLVKHTTKNLIKLLLSVPFIFTFLFLWSCSPDEKIVTDQEVTFSISDIHPTGTDGGRVATNNEINSVLVTIKDNSGAVVTNRKELELHEFNDEFLSVPLTLKTTGASKYYLTDFLVLNDEGQVVYATPREGSELAHLVSDPLDIEFAVSKDAITTVTPEVLTVAEHSTPEDFGYGQFGFKVVNTIDAVFSAFVKGVNNFELTDAHLRIDALSGYPTDTIVTWNFEVSLAAKANLLKLKKATNYRITATKAGYGEWTEITTLSDQSKIEIILEKKEHTVDVYAAGVDGFRATYWKNGVPTQLENATSHASSIYVVDHDVYASGSMYMNRQPAPPFFWKNGEKVFLSVPHVNGIWGETEDIIVNDNNFFVVGRYVASNRSVACYWKNDALTQLQIPNALGGRGRKMAIDGTDVYVAGYIQKTWNTSLTTAALWKNGEYIALEVPPIYSVSMANSVKFSNGHVYVSGYVLVAPYTNDRPVVVYWKDGLIEYIDESPSSFSSIDVTGDDVYISYTVDHGTEARQARLWKNGKSTQVDESALIYTYDLSVSHDEVYLAGTYKQNVGDNATACYWVNGKRIPLQSLAESQAVSCFVARND